MRPRRKFGPSQKERIFFAALPDENTCARIHAFAEAQKREKGFTANLILPEHLHVTLFHLGDWPKLPEEIVNLALGAASQANVPVFEVAFARAQSFRNSTGVYPFVLTSDKTAWRGLHDALAMELKNAGLGGATKGDFEPHITLAYDKLRVKPFATDPIAWTVRDFVLITPSSARRRIPISGAGPWPKFHRERYAPPCGSLYVFPTKRPPCPPRTFPSAAERFSKR
jgi:2'-5' RNA ligase